MLYHLYLKAMTGFDAFLSVAIDDQAARVIDRSFDIQSRVLSRNVRWVAGTSREFVRLLTDLPRLDAVRIAGAKGSIVYVGPSDPVQKIIVRALFPDGHQEASLGRVVLWHLPGLAKLWLQDADLVVCRVSRRFPWHIDTPYSFDNPLDVWQVLTLDKSLEDLFAGRPRQGLRRKIRKMQAANFAARFSTSLADLHLFFQRMYRPSVESRFGERGVVSPYEVLQSWMKRGILMLLDLHGEEVGGAVMYVQNGTCYWGFTGMLDGESDLLNEGLGIAIKWYAIEWAIGQGATSFSFMGSQAWETDGVFRAKQLWGAKVVDDPYAQRQLLFRANGLSASWREYLNQVGFLARVRGKYLRVYIDDEDRPYTGAEVEDQKVKALERGLSGVQIVGRGSRRNLLIGEPAGLA